MARYVSVVESSPLSPMLIAFNCTLFTFSRTPWLYTANLPARLRDTKVDFLMDNRNARLRHTNVVLGELFFREEELAVTNLRGYVHRAMEGVQGVSEGLVIHRHKTDMIITISV